MNIQSINFDSNSKYQILGFSVATFLYYRLNLEGARIKDFQSSKTKSILRLRAQYSGGLAIKKGVCQKVSSRYFDEGLELVDCFNKGIY